jgi:Glycosyltransferase family 87
VRAAGSVRSGWSGPSTREVARAVLVPYVLSRFLVLASLGLTREVVRDISTVTDPIQTGQGLRAWDAAFYVDIARSGYDAVETDGLRFFPLFPLLGRALALVPGIDTDLAVVLVANLSALALGFALYRLAWSERRDEGLARRSVWLVYLLPPAFVLVMGYAEATLMLLAAIVLFGARQGRWWVAAIAGVLAGACRPIGLLLVVPVLVEAVQHRRAINGREVAMRVAAVAAPVAGCFAYLSWASDRTDSFLAPLKIQEDPSRRGAMRFPLTNIIDVARDFSTGDHDTAGLHLLTIVVCVGLLVVLARRWPASYTLYAAASLVVALTARNLDSLERYMLSTLPFVLALADVIDTEARERVVLILSAAGLVAAAVLAFSGALVP